MTSSFGKYFHRRDSTVMMTLSFNVPLGAFRATCGWKRRTSNPLFIILALIFLLSLCIPPSHSQCTRADAQTPMDCIPGRTTFNNDTCSCVPCSLCNKVGEMFVQTQCTVTQDSVCDCHSPLYYDRDDEECIIDCYECPGGLGCIAGTDSCDCPRKECYLPGDIYCRNPTPPCVPEITSPTTPSTNPPPSLFDQDAFPAWGIGLIAIGIVIGIIIFASCFLCMGLFSLHKNRDPESQGSEASENGLVSRESFGSAGTSSSYLSSNSLYPYLNNHNMLELLKSSHPQLVKSNSNRLSSLQSSPVSSRSSPKPGRTVRLTKNADTDKLTAIVM